MTVQCPPAFHVSYVAIVHASSSRAIFLFFFFFFFFLLLLLLLLLTTSIGLSPGGSGYFTSTQNMKLVTTKFKSGGLHEKHVVATWSLKIW